MKFTIIDVPQGSAEWKAARAGRLTGSCAKHVLAKGKAGEAATRADYRFQLLCERLTGMPADDIFITKEMQWGTDQEPFARMAYEAKTGIIVRETGFLRCDDVMAGASVDGDVDNFAGIVEFKCPKTKTHLGWMDNGEVPAEHLPQITCNLWISGAGWCDFVSYDPRLPAGIQLFVKRVRREDVDIPGFESAALQFLREVDDAESKYRAMNDREVTP